MEVAFFDAGHLVEHLGFLMVFLDGWMGGKRDVFFYMFLLYMCLSWIKQVVPFQKKKGKEV